MPSVLNGRARLLYLVFECLHLPESLPSEIPNSAFVQYFTPLHISRIFRNFLQVGLYLPLEGEEIKI